MTHSNVRPATATDLQPGDVLMCLGDSDLSHAIRLLDGGSYSHAALWEGDGLIESTLPFVRRAPLLELADHSLLVDVYRHREVERVRPTILQSARSYLARPYGALNLGLSTLVVATSVLAPGAWSSLNVLYGAGNLKRIVGLLSTMVRQLESPRVTCVELVARAFSEASAPVSIRLEGHGSFDAASFLKAVRSLIQRMRSEHPATIEGPGGLLSEDSLEWLEELERRVESGQPAPPGDARAWVGLRRQWEADLGLAALPAVLSPAGDIVPQLLELSAQEIRAKTLVVGRNWAPELLTPRQLERSPELELIGRIHQR